MSRKAPRIQATVKLLNLIDIERGASLRAESAAVAVSVARELSEGMTRAERIAADEFLTDVARAVRWPADNHPVQAPVALIHAGHDGSRKRPGWPVATTGMRAPRIVTICLCLLTAPARLNPPLRFFPANSPVRSGGLLLRRGC
jgi:hypothetical protein